ncbi:flagellar hook-length control protein FliK [Erwinia sp. D4-22]
MMINVIAAQPGTAPVGAASAHQGENTGFANLLGTQLAAVTGRVVTPAMPTKEDDADKLSEEEMDAAAAGLIPVGLAEAMIAPLPPEAVTASQSAAVDLTTTAPQIAVSGNAYGMLNNEADALVSESDAAQNVRHSATDGMLRMIASPQSAHHARKAATPQEQYTPAPTEFIKPAINVAPALESEPESAVLPVDNRSPAMPLTASPAFSPASLAAPSTAAPSAANAALPVAHGMLEPEVGSPAWQQALGQKLNAFTRNGIHHAELRLHPEHLGPLHIKLRLEQDQVQLHFVTDQQPVRAALEAAMPHLRTSLADAGIQLDQGSVGRDASAWGSSADSHSGQSSHSQNGANGSPLIEVEEEITPQRIHSPLGISIFA